MIDNVLSGIVLVNKPAGVSSNTAVNIVKHSLNAKKAGHLGTLDLEAEGLLPVTINSATRLFDFFLKKDKTYETIFIFGFETDTLDLSGKIVKEKYTDVSIDSVNKACQTMIGKQLQKPPIYSAKKVGGKVAYKEALKGNALSLEPKEIEIFDMKILEQCEKNTFRLEISCSSGTYVRSICRDLAIKLSTYGTVKSILRKRCGGFLLKDSYSLDEIKNGEAKIIACEKLFDFQSIYLTGEETRKILNGMAVTYLCKDGNYKLFADKLFLGIGKVDKNFLKLTLRLL